MILTLDSAIFRFSSISIYFRRSWITFANRNSKSRLEIAHEVFNISWHSLCIGTDIILYLSIHESFRARKFVLLAIEVNKSVGKWRKRVKKLSSMHNAIKKLHSTQFVFLHSQLVNQKQLFSSTPPTLQHEMLIKLLFIAIDAFNGENTKSFYDFCNSIFYNSRYVILEFYSTLNSLVLVCHSREMFSEWAKKCTKRIKYLHAPYNPKLTRCDEKSEVFVDFWRLNIWKLFREVSIKRIYNWQSMKA